MVTRYRIFLHQCLENLRWLSVSSLNESQKAILSEALPNTYILKQSKSPSKVVNELFANISHF